MNDQRFFDAVAQEQRENRFDENLWLKAMAVSDNDRGRAQAAYVTLRVEQLKDLLTQQLNVARVSGKVFRTCPSCDCAGPFPSRWMKKLGLLLSLLPLGGFYYMRAEMLPIVEDVVKRGVFDTSLVPMQLLWSLAFAGPFFIVLIVSRGAVKCPSCGYSFWFNKNGAEGSSLLKAL